MNRRDRCNPYNQNDRSRRLFRMQRRPRETSSPSRGSSHESWYDHPQYFDMAFRDETASEVAFLELALSRYVQPMRETAMRLYEPGCGSGRLVAAMAARGHHVVALDNNQAMLDYLAARVKRSRRIANRGGQAEWVLGDMTTHVCRPVVDAAFCTFNTFRHLTTPEAAESHLRAVAESIRPGGIYVLGFHCLPMDVDPESIERWTAVHGRTKVAITFRVTDFNRRARLEQIRVTIKATDTKTDTVRRIRSEFPLRLYTPRQARTLMSDVSDVFELVAIHDFDYDIDVVRKVDRDLIDAVFVLRRRQR